MASANSRPAVVPSDPALPVPSPYAGARLGVLTSLGALSGAVPLPFIPAKMLRSIRGAIAHDVATRHGVSLSAAARDALAEPDSSDARRADLLRVASFVAARVLKRLGPIGFVAPALAGLDAFVLGHLLQRYFALHRHLADRRMGRDEAASVRHSVDRALLRALSPGLRTPRDDVAELPPEDARDDTTRLTDGVLLFAASLPGFFVRRLETAFDELMFPGDDRREPTP
ncbi:MAG TPA: hypothetical protein PLI95_11950 [Polyangiaceae bacterium]|nr:hypothetical protein [Polyangiaceae bacterium]